MAGAMRGQADWTVQYGPGFDDFLRGTDVTSAWQTAKQSNKEQKVSYGGRSFYVQPDGKVLSDSKAMRVYGNITKAGTAAIMGYAGFGLASSFLGGAGAGAGASGGGISSTAGAIPGGEFMTPPIGAIGGIGSSGTVGSAAASAGGMGSAGSKIKSLISGNPFEKIGDVFSSGAKTSADNRRDEFNAVSGIDETKRRSQNDFDTLRLRAQEDADRNGFEASQNRRADTSDAWKKLQYSEYINSGGRPYTPASGIKGYEGALPSFGFGPKAPTDAERQGAGMMRDETLKMLAPGGSFQPSSLFQPTPMFQPDDRLESLMKPSKGEKVQDWIGRIASIFGSFNPFGGD